MKKLFFLELVIILSAISTQSVSREQPLGSIRGRVVDQEQAPVAGAKAYATPIDRPIKGRIAKFSTDADGGFLIPALFPGRYFVHASKESAGYPDTFFGFNSGGRKVLEVDVLSGKETSALVELGPKGAKLIVEVFDSATKAPIADDPTLKLTLAKPSDGSWVGLGGSVEGRFEILVPANAPFLINIEAKGYKDKDIGEADSVTIELAPEGMLRLRVGMVAEK